MFQKYLEDKKFFKLICGAGNQDIQEIEKLVEVYASAGANCVDISADVNVINAVKTTLKKLNKDKDVFICVSIGVTDDIHLKKIKIKNSICKLCGQCVSICNRNALSIKQEELFYYEKRCIGCGKCISACSVNNIEYYSKNNSIEDFLLSENLSDIDCIEFHVSGENYDEIFKTWNILNEKYSGILSISINRRSYSDEKLISLLKELLMNRKPFTTIIQADGNPMSGGKDDFHSTLQAVSTADLINQANLSVYTILAGGTNSKSSELAKLCGVNINGVAIGSYARLIVKDDINNNDINSAISKAKLLIENSLNIKKATF